MYLKNLVLINTAQRAIGAEQWKMTNCRRCSAEVCFVKGHKRVGGTFNSPLPPFLCLKCGKGFYYRH